MLAELARLTRLLWSQPMLALTLPLLLLGAVAIRLLRPFVVVRLGKLSSTRIGELVGRTEHYLCQRDAGLLPRRTIDLFFHVHPICNEHLRIMVDRIPGLHVSRAADYVHRVSRRLPGAQAHVIPDVSERDTRGLLTRFPPHFTFTEKELARGREEVMALGVPAGAPYICFHARDSAYMRSVWPDQNWAYLAYRDCSIQSYLPAVRELIARGIYAIRVGAVVSEPLGVHDPRIIDYSSSRLRSDFLDVYLTATCLFYLGNTAGLVLVPAAFRRPAIWANMIPLEYAPSWAAGHLFIPKKLWVRAERRLLTLPETLQSGVGRFFRTELFEQAGLEIIDNTPEEIAAVAREMDDRIAGRWQTTDRDDELQARFWALFGETDWNGVRLSRIGAEFLREHCDGLL